MTRPPQAAGWYLLIHHLPPKPIYLRAKIGARLARVGGVALKNSVYVLPEREDCLEDLQWIAEEASAGGGTAFVCRVEFLDDTTESALVKRFLENAGEAYESLKTELAAMLDAIRKGDETTPGPNEAALSRVKKKLAEAAKIDFFEAPTKKEVEAMVRAIEDELRRTRTYQGGPVKRSDLVGRVWVTRRNPKVDRLASAWLIRRFIDPGARFRFVEPREPLGADELGFDIVGGTFTHEGDRCTFETLLERAGISEPGLATIAEIVHDIDLKDEKYARAEATGVQTLVQGLIQAHVDDQERVDHALALFDTLLASFRPSPTKPSRAKKTAAKRHR